jgi:hypothetical protein
MVESSLAAVRRLLETALEVCESDECAFQLRTALQLLEAVEQDIAAEHIDLAAFEDGLEDEELRSRLEDAGILE